MRKTLSLLLLACCTQASAKQLELTFDIYLNEDPIGVHRVQIEEATKSASFSGTTRIAAGEHCRPR